MENRGTGQKARSPHCVFSQDPSPRTQSITCSSFQTFFRSCCMLPSVLPFALITDSRNDL